MQAIYKSFAADNHWEILLPEISMVALALLLLLYELFGRGSFKSGKNHSGTIAIAGQIAILAALLSGAFGNAANGIHFGGLVKTSYLGDFGRIFFLSSSILTSLLACTYLNRHPLAKAEFHHLTILIAAALMLLLQSHHFVMLFVALETATIGFYVLVSYCRHNAQSLEGGLKYLILGALSSTILLFGSVLVYGAVGTGTTGLDGMNFAAIQEFAGAQPEDSLLRVGLLLILLGLLFKVGIVPFQIWIPDVYQGAPTPVTAYLSVASKTAGLLVMLQLLTGPFVSLQTFVTPLLSLLAAITILFGNITALTQRNVKRIMGLSGIAHAGYMLVGVIAAFQVPEMATRALIIYLGAYLLASYSVFGIMTWNAGHEDADQTLDDYLEFGEKHPALGFVLVIGLASLAGIPPLAGFIGKLLLFMAAWKAGLTTLLYIAVIGVAASIFYYFGWIQEATFRFWKAKDPTAENQEELQTAPSTIISTGLLWTLILLTAATVILGFYQEFIPV